MRLLNHIRSGVVQNPKKVRSALCIGIFLLVTIFIFLFAGRPLIAFVSEPEPFRQWVSSNGIWGYFSFIGMMFLQVVVAIIPGEPLEIVAGYAFGFWTGTALCMIGTTLGSIVVFLFVRRWGVRAVEVFFPTEKLNSMQFMRNEKKLGLLLFILFFIPGTPKDIMTYCVGLTNMRLRNWMLISTFARIPSIVTSTIGGEALGIQNYQFAVIVFGATLIISGIGVVIFRIFSRRHSDGEITRDAEDGQIDAPIPNSPETEHINLSE